MSVSFSQLLNIRVTLAKYLPFNFGFFGSQMILNSCAFNCTLCSTTSAVLCFIVVQDFLGLEITLAPSWYTRASTVLNCSSSPLIHNIPIFVEMLSLTSLVDAFLFGSLNWTLWLPKIGVSGTNYSWSTIFFRRSASFCGDDDYVMLGVQAVAPLLTLTVPGTVLKTTCFNKATCCWFKLAISAMVVAVFGLINSWSSTLLKFFSLNFSM